MQSFYNVLCKIQHSKSEHYSFHMNDTFIIYIILSHITSSYHIPYHPITYHIILSHTTSSYHIQKRPIRKPKFQDGSYLSGSYSAVTHCITIHTYVRTYIHTYVRTYLHTYIHTYVQTYIHTHTYVRTYVHTYVRTYVRTYVCTHVHTYVHLHSHLILIFEINISILMLFVACWF